MHKQMVNKYSGDIDNMKMEKGQPKDTTGAGPGKDSYQSKSSGQHHQMPKKRQDGKGSGKGPNAGDHVWDMQDSLQEGENF